MSQNETISPNILRNTQRTWAESCRRLFQNHYKSGPVEFDVFGAIKAEYFIPVLQRITDKNLDKANGGIKLLSSFMGECFIRKYGYQWYLHNGMPFLMRDAKTYFSPKEMLEDRFWGLGKPLQKQFQEPVTYYSPSDSSTELQIKNN